MSKSLVTRYEVGDSFREQSFTVWGIGYDTFEGFKVSFYLHGRGYEVFLTCGG